MAVIQQSGIILQSNLSYVRVFYYGQTAQTLACTLSKAGGAFNANGAGPSAIIEIANGFYKIILSSVDTGIQGDLAYNITGGANTLVFTDQVQTQVFQQLTMNAAGQPLVASNLKQNTTAVLPFTMTAVTSLQPLPGLTITAQRSFVPAAFTACANSPVEVGGAGNGSGNYSIVLNPSDTNAAAIIYRFTAGGANDLNIGIIMQP